MNRYMNMEAVAAKLIQMLHSILSNDAICIKSNQKMSMQHGNSIIFLLSQYVSYLIPNSSRGDVDNSIFSRTKHLIVL